ncbi:uncharacterized protein LOC141534446 isoform X3 [Cotesia typhae]|uniref:uncharacterized protein LOC141534446 isoform X3 n=1 Tax=Cotesia typhae TaxID=2053667 RepID=UPI003D6929BB
MTAFFMDVDDKSMVVLILQIKKGNAGNKPLSILKFKVILRNLISTSITQQHSRREIQGKRITPELNSIEHENCVRLYQVLQP